MPVNKRQFVVSRRPGRRALGLVRLGSRVLGCALGRSGMVAIKREGDGCTPCGRLALGVVLYRADRIGRPRTKLPVRAIRRGEGWCDAPGDRNYNRRVELPYPASAERLWREDRLYDLVVVLDYNIRPRARGLGSAIFLHVARDGLAPTEGCVALRLADLLRLLASARRGDALVVRR
jgi:L,D-peptidoglycan transpeptidase YkuD (ErfK/YbiS/YcfS/YnhG family)